jgi:hypothetical protein
LLTFSGTAPTPIRPDKNETNGGGDHREDQAKVRDDSGEL